MFFMWICIALSCIHEHSLYLSFLWLLLSLVLILHPVLRNTLGSHSRKWLKTSLCPNKHQHKLTMPHYSIFIMNHLSLYGDTTVVKFSSESVFSSFSSVVFLNNVSDQVQKRHDPVAACPSHCKCHNGSALHGYFGSKAELNSFHLWLIMAFLSPSYSLDCYQVHYTPYNRSGEAGMKCYLIYTTFWGVGVVFTI